MDEFVQRRVTTRVAVSVSRWTQLVLGMLCMAMAANLQYGWTLFVNPMHQKMGWSLAAIQVAFTLFVLVETWLVPLEGWLVDRAGPGPVVLVGGLLCALSWITDSYAESLPVLYLAAVIGGIGAGCVYGACIGNALKWFPDRRGLAAGLTAAGFGAGAALTVLPIAMMINDIGYQATLLNFAFVQGAVIIIAAMFLNPPAGQPLPPALRPPVPRHPAPRDCPPAQVLKTPLFWLLYGLFVSVAAGGLIATAQLAPMAHDYRLAGAWISLPGLVLPALPLVLSLNNIVNGLTRPLSGWLSDRLGRENTMLLMFSLEGVALLGLVFWGHTPALFVLASALVFFAWGEIFSIFPATAADTFGTRHAAANCGLLYTAKGVAAFLVPLASLATQQGGHWVRVLVGAAAVNLGAGLVAKGVLQPLRRRWLQRLR